MAKNCKFLKRRKCFIKSMLRPKIVTVRRYASLAFWDILGSVEDPDLPMMLVLQTAGPQVPHNTLFDVKSNSLFDPNSRYNVNINVNVKMVISPKLKMGC